MKYIILLIVSLLFLGCSDYRTKAWYPKSKLSIECNNKTYIVFYMDHTTGWSSVPYYIDIETKKEIGFSGTCVVLTLEKYSKWEGRPSVDNRNSIQIQNTYVAEEMERQ